VAKKKLLSNGEIVVATIRTGLVWLWPSCCHLSEVKADHFFTNRITELASAQQ